MLTGGIDVLRPSPDFRDLAGLLEPVAQSLNWHIVVVRVCEKNGLHLLQVCFGFFQAQLQIGDLTVQHF
jgi:hypothetical protein